MWLCAHRIFRALPPIPMIGTNRHSSFFSLSFPLHHQSIRYTHVQSGAPREVQSGPTKIHTPFICLFLLPLAVPINQFPVRPLLPSARGTTCLRCHFISSFTTLSMLSLSNPLVTLMIPFFFELRFDDHVPTTDVETRSAAEDDFSV